MQIFMRSSLAESVQSKRTGRWRNRTTARQRGKHPGRADDRARPPKAGPVETAAVGERPARLASTSASGMLPTIARGDRWTTIEAIIYLSHPPHGWIMAGMAGS